MVAASTRQLLHDRAVFTQLAGKLIGYDWRGVAMGVQLEVHARRAQRGYLVRVQEREPTVAYEPVVVGAEGCADRARKFVFLPERHLAPYPFVANRRSDTVALRDRAELIFTVRQARH